MRRLYRGLGIFLSLCAVFLLTACARDKEEEKQQEEIRQEVFQVTRQDEVTEPQDPQDINLSDCGKEPLFLTEGGDFWIYGSLHDGQIVIDADEDELVHLYLAGVNISSGRGPAILVEEASKVIVTLVSGTENVLSDSPDYTDYEERQACLYSVPDLTVNGDGSLRVFGYHEDGIRSKDRVKILGGSLEVQAKGDGIRGSDGILITEAMLTIQSEQNGLRTANQGAGGKGVVEIRGGTLSLIAGRNGIYAASDLYMRDCVCSVNAVEERTRTEGTAYIAEGCLNQ